MQNVEKKVQNKIFNERFKQGFLVAIIGDQKFDIEHLANFLIADILPNMVNNNESCFFWHYTAKNVMCMSEEKYHKERERFENVEKFKCENFNTVWTVKFQMPNGTNMIAEISNEVWFNDEENHPISPFAFVFDAPFADGYMLSLVKFKKAV